MDVLPKFVSMAKTPQDLAEEVNEVMSPISTPQSIYPPGLCIYLTEVELEKLGLGGDCEVGDRIHIHCMGEVTSVNERQTTDGMKCRIEIQIQDISCENESEEDEEAEEAMEYGAPRKIDLGKFYK